MNRGPLSVKDTLKRMKNISSLMVDLGFYSALYRDEALADGILRLGSEVNRLKFNLMMQAGLASRTPEDAETMISVYQLAISMGKICDEAQEIARIDKSDLSVRFPVGFASTDSVVCRSSVSQGSWAEGKSLSDVFRQLDTVMNVLLVRREGKWVIEPDPKFGLKSGDTLFTVGSLGNLKRFRETVGCAEPAPPDESVSEIHKKVVAWLARLLSVTDLVVDLAYSALLTSSEDIAKRVVELEEYTDRILREFENDVVSSEQLLSDEKVALLEIATASERIADAAREMTDVILHGLGTHPIIADVLQESEERMTVIRVSKEDSGSRIQDLHYDSYGAAVLAVKRGDEWSVRPNHGEFRVEEGDLLIVKYFSESSEIAEFAEDLKSEEERERIIDELREEEAGES